MASKTILAGMKFSFTGTQNSHDHCAIDEHYTCRGVHSFEYLCTYSTTAKNCPNWTTRLDLTINANDQPRHAIIWMPKKRYSFSYYWSFIATLLRVQQLYNSKSWKLVFRGFPFMGMFDWGGVLIQGCHGHGKVLTESGANFFIWIT